jgi:hypothetical protein
VSSRHFWGLICSATLGASALAYGLIVSTSSLDASMRLTDAMVASAVETLSSPTFVAFVLGGAWFVHCIMDVRSTRLLTRLIRVGSYTGSLINVAGRSARTLVVPTVIVVVGATFPAFVRGALPRASGVRPSSSALSGAISPSVLLVAQMGLLAGFLIVVRVMVELAVVVANHATAVSCAH